MLLKTYSITLINMIFLPLALIAGYALYQSFREI